VILQESEFQLKMIAEYLEHALQFERLAGLEEDPSLKADFENQAKAYRKLAAERTRKHDLEGRKFST